MKAVELEYGKDSDRIACKWGLELTPQGKERLMEEVRNSDVVPTPEFLEWWSVDGLRSVSIEYGYQDSFALSWCHARSGLETDFTDFIIMVNKMIIKENDNE